MRWNLDVEPYIARRLLAHLSSVAVLSVVQCGLVSADEAGSRQGAGSDVSHGASSSGSSSSHSGRVLNGSANDKATVKQSVRLIPPTSERPLLNGGANVKQFNGQAQFSPGSPLYPAKAIVNSTPASFSPQRQYPRNQQFTQLFPARIYAQGPHVPYTPPAAPKWNYSITPKNGIMTWAPAYQVSHVAQPRRANVFNVTSASIYQQKLDAMARSNKVNPNGASWTGTGAKRLQSESGAPPAVAALSATPQLLSEVTSAKEKKSINWEDWYKRVCNTIYQQWILDEACPGKACVRVTVWSSRDIEAKVLTFTPADGASRDAYKETGFRETSLRAINSLQKTEILEFPAFPARNRVIFDLDMNRSVNGPSGCVVAAFHDGADLPASTRSAKAPATRDYHKSKKSKVKS